VPYFLNTGVLLKRIDTRVAEARSGHPDIEIIRGEHLGLHPRLLDLIERRAREGLNDALAHEGLMAVCGRSSCASVARGRSGLLVEGVPAAP
jgi:sirohydrochlorin ferrochelatase